MNDLASAVLYTAVACVAFYVAAFAWRRLRAQRALAKERAE